MAGYTKNIAVIKGLKSGFSADGGALSGIVKAEKYGSYFRAEISLINFAPLTEGRYVVGITDGEHTVVCEQSGCECETQLDTSHGFAAVVCFVHTEVCAIAAAVCGDLQWATAGVAREVERQEKIRNQSAVSVYEDEAIAEDNYFEYYKDTEKRGAIRADEEQKDGSGVRKDEADSRIRKDKEGNLQPMRAERRESLSEGSSGVGERAEKNSELSDEAAGRIGQRGSGGGEHERSGDEKEGENFWRAVPLAEDLKFYESMEEEIERLLSHYPREEELERTVENSRWVRVTYGGERYYVFGVIYSDETPAYICYGVPSQDCGNPPESLQGMASYIPVGKGGYWVMYQDAKTGAGIRIDAL